MHYCEYHALCADRDHHAASCDACRPALHGRSESYRIAYSYADRQGERFPDVFADWATDCGWRDGEHVDAAFARYLRGMDRLAFALGLTA